MRKALIVGINYYQHQKSLYGCVNDAYAVKTILDRHENGTVNFTAKLLTATDENNLVKKSTLRDHIIELFKSKDEVVFYFSGHGYLDEDTGGYLMTSECENGDDGFPMRDLIEIANKSEAKNKIIILDSCHSGFAGTDYQSDNSLLSKGTTILTAASEAQYATEENGSGIFTSLLVDALSGGASNLMGDITPGSVYAHIDQSLGPWDQRPLFKTNIENFVSLRKVHPPIPFEDLNKLTSLFIEKGQEFKLNPSFEPTESSAIKENTEKFATLQKYESVGLVIPKDTEHMYYAAIESKSCVLTLLGQHYWNLVKNGRI